VGKKAAAKVVQKIQHEKTQRLCDIFFFFERAGLESEMTKALSKSRGMMSRMKLSCSHILYLFIVETNLASASPEQSRLGVQTLAMVAKSQGRNFW
jgi:hypothetical protein